MSSETSLVTASPGGPSTDAFRELFEQHAVYVWRSLRRFGVRPADVPDQVQEVFLVLYHRMAEGRYDAGLPPRPYLAAIAFRTASDYRRKGSTQREVLVDEEVPGSPAPDAEDLMAGAEERSIVLAALEQLPEERRVVFVMHDIDEIPIPEIARALEVPQNTAYSRLRLAREGFQKAVARIVAGNAGPPRQGAERRTSNVRSKGQ